VYSHPPPIPRSVLADETILAAHVGLVRSYVAFRRRRTLVFFSSSGAQSFPSNIPEVVTSFTISPRAEHWALALRGPFVSADDAPQLLICLEELRSLRPYPAVGGLDQVFSSYSVPLLYVPILSFFFFGVVSLFERCWVRTASSFYSLL